MGFDNFGNGGSKDGSVGFDNVSNGGNKGGSVGFGNVVKEGKGGSVGFGNFGSDGKGGNEGNGGSVGLGNVGMIGKFGILGWEDCKRWRVARVTSILKIAIVMNKTKMKHLNAIAIGVLLRVTRL